MSSPTQRSLKYLRGLGWTCQVVEHFNVYAKIKQDLFGFIDILAIRKGSILGVQTTTNAHVATRIEKAKGLDELRLWLEAGGVFTVHGWALKGERGQRKTWEVRSVQVKLEDL